MLMDVLELLGRITRMAFSAGDATEFVISLRPEGDFHVLTATCDGNVFVDLLKDGVDPVLLASVSRGCLRLDVGYPGGMRRFRGGYVIEETNGTQAGVCYVEMEIRASGQQAYDSILNWFSDCLPPPRLSMQLQGRIVRSRAPLRICDLRVGLMMLSVEVHHRVDDERPALLLGGGVPLFPTTAPYTINIVGGATWAEARALDQHLRDAVKEFDD
jgi:hypothetical protein